MARSRPARGSERGGAPSEHRTQMLCFGEKPERDDDKLGHGWRPFYFSRQSWIDLASCSLELSPERRQVKVSPPYMSRAALRSKHLGEREQIAVDTRAGLIFAMDPPLG